MALTPEQILEYRKKYNIAPVGGMSVSSGQNKPSFSTDLMGDIKETGSDLFSTAKNTFGKVKESIKPLFKGEQGIKETMYQASGSLAGGVANAIGDVVKGGVKAVLPEESEASVKNSVESVAKPVAQNVMENPFVQNLMSRYESLDADTKRNIDATLGFASLASEFVGGGLVKKPVQAVVEGGIDLAKNSARGVNDVVGMAKNGVSNIAESAVKPENIMQRVARINPTEQVKFKDISGETVGEYLTKRKIFGSSEEVATKLVEKFQESKSIADDALGTLEGTFRPTPVKTVLQELFQKEKSISSPGALSQDFKRVQALQKKFEADGLTMSEINEVKRLFERNVKLDYVKQNLPDGVKRSKTLDSAIREWQVEQAERLGLKNLPQLNKETMYAKMLADALGKKLAGSEANNIVSLTDWVAMSGGDPTAAAMFFGKKALNSSKLQSKIAEKISSKKPSFKVDAEYGKRKPDLTDFLSR